MGKRVTAVRYFSDAFQICNAVPWMLSVVRRREEWAIHFKSSDSFPFSICIKLSSGEEGLLRTQFALV